MDVRYISVPHAVHSCTISRNEQRVAEETFTKCYLMELESAPSFKTWTCRRAGWAIDELDQDILAHRKHGLNGKGRLRT
jgi:hypothetical protein